MAGGDAPSFKPPLVSTTICLLFLCVAYLPIKNNALVTLNLSRLDFSEIYTSELVVGVKTEYIPGWINKTDTAWRYAGGNHYYRVYKTYSYPSYQYRTHKKYTIGPKLPSNLTLKDTNFCDKYSLGLWGYWGESKTNGVSHHVLQRPSPDTDPISVPYLEPYALKNNTALQSTANIWDIVAQGRPDGVSHVTKEQSPLYNYMRITIILLSTVFFIHLLLYSLVPSFKSGRQLLDKPTPAHELFYFLSTVSVVIELIITFGTIPASLASVYDLQDSLVNIALERIGVTSQRSSQMKGLLGTTIALSFINTLVTLGCAGDVTEHLKALLVEHQQPNNAVV